MLISFRFKFKLQVDFVFCISEENPLIFFSSINPLFQIFWGKRLIQSYCRFPFLRTFMYRSQRSDAETGVVVFRRPHYIKEVSRNQEDLTQLIAKIQVFQVHYKLYSVLKSIVDRSAGGDFCGNSRSFLHRKRSGRCMN